MNRLLVSLAATLFLSIQLIRGADDEGTFNIVQGNCSDALAKELVYREHVYKYAFPLIERNATASWHGDPKIYCLKALNENEESSGGIAFVKEGGVNHSFVTVEMHSKRGNKLDYEVQIYAK